MTRKDPDYEKMLEEQQNKEWLKELEDRCPMTTKERNFIRAWVGKGNSPYTNPWKYIDDDGWPLNILEAYRRCNGYFYFIKLFIRE